MTMPQEPDVRSPGGHETTAPTIEADREQRCVPLGYGTTAPDEPHPWTGKLTRDMCERHYVRWWRATPRDERPRPKWGRREGLDQAAFWGRVDKSGGCWIWTGHTDREGYGRHGGRGLAHRLSWEIANEQPVPDGLFVLHHCDNPPCVNPAHLYVGTNQDNVNDMVARGRARNRNTGKTHCVRGHELSGHNLVLHDHPNGSVTRQCRMCANAHSLEYQRILAATAERCHWCGRPRRSWSEWEQERLSGDWSRLCSPCAKRRLGNPWCALLPMRRIGDAK